MTFDEIKKFYALEEYPSLALRTRQWSESRPLAGVKILDGTPVFRNTVLKYLALIGAGAELTVGISQVMPYDPEVVKFLRESGIPVVHADDTPSEQDIILDCAGAFSGWNPRIGVSELTRSGAHVYSDAGKPVFLADEGRIKRIETCLGTGDGFFRAMEQLGYSEWAGRRIVVFGSGKVGTGIILKAVKYGAVVDVVTDLSTLSSFVRGMVHRAVDFRDAAAVEDLICPAGSAENGSDFITVGNTTCADCVCTPYASYISSALDSSCISRDGDYYCSGNQDRASRNTYVVVTATGVKGAVGSCCHAAKVIASGALLANMGVEDEFGDDFPASAVLNDKRPLNFILEEPTHMRYIEATMALHNEGALYLLRGQVPSLHPEDMAPEVASHSAGTASVMSGFSSVLSGATPYPAGIITPPAEMEAEILDITRRAGLIADELDLIDHI